MLSTVADYVSEARVLLQDRVAPYRYTDDELVSGLNAAMFAARRLRSDLFIDTTVPSFTTVDTTAVTMDIQYRMALVYFIVGEAQLKDEEDTQDNRAAAFIGKFTAQLLSIAG